MLFFQIITCIHIHSHNTDVRKNKSIQIRGYSTIVNVQSRNIPVISSNLPKQTVLKNTKLN